LAIPKIGSVKTFYTHRPEMEANINKIYYYKYKIFKIIGQKKHQGK